MYWPWRRSSLNKHLVISWSGQTLAYVLAHGNAANGFTIHESGVKRNCAVNIKELVNDLRAFNLDDLEVRVMLRPGQYQLLQIESSVVEPAELRAAARYQIKDMLDIPVDEVRLDFVRVGDGQHKGTAQFFVVATPIAVVENMLDLCKSMRWKLSIIDIHEMAQRNLQTALTARGGDITQAHPALIWVDEFHAVLTISANGEMFNTRRFDFLQGLSAGFEEIYIKSSSVASKKSFFEVIDYESRIGESDVSSKILSDGADQYSSSSTLVNDIWADSQLQRFLMELKRSFDLWERVWPSMPLGALWLDAGCKTKDLAEWLRPRLEQNVQPMDVKLLFPDFEVLGADESLCLPLLGMLLRVENRIF